LLRRGGVYTSGTMPRKMNLVLVLGLFAVLCAFGAAVTLFPLSNHLSPADLQPRAPIERPFEVLISCDSHKQQYGWTWYGGDAPTRALFAGCRPTGNLYLVAPPSTQQEACETRNRPEVAFDLTELGEVKNVMQTRGSGNPSVDRKVLKMIRDSRYPATNCGACAMQTIVMTRKRIVMACPD
jgi:hypothetical protein